MKILSKQSTNQQQAIAVKCNTQRQSELQYSIIETYL